MDCLTATCDLCENGLAGIYQSSAHGARPNWGLRPPGGDRPAAQRASPRLRTRSRARRGSRVNRPGRLGERGGAGCGRTGSGAAVPERALIGMAAVQGYMQWTWREPAGGAVNRLRCGWSSDSDGRSLHRWTGTTCRAASLDCSKWSEWKD